ncbi:MAG: alpha/beta hydrolase [Chloroflexi bacterium]|nr:alpha/beta hydrolase [Chloroflexota bacterium]MCC6891391.1 alpha/beta hydrolase [Anaerolineae bacterium]
MGEAAVKTGCVTTEGDELYYEVRGQGQPLLMIAGGGGDAGFFTRAAEILAADYKVITYDRRGNSRSTRNPPQNFDIRQQSRDAVAVLHHLDERSAYVFGSSGGAVIALDMAATQPQAVRAAIVHEPPLVRIHPHHRGWHQFFAGIYWFGYTFGAPFAMMAFASQMGIPSSGYRSVPPDAADRMSKNHDFFIKNEMLPFTNYQPDIQRLKTSGIPLFMAAGQITLKKKKFYGETASILASQLRCNLVTFPGHHISYIEHAEDWSAALRGILRSVR